MAVLHDRPIRGTRRRAAAGAVLAAAAVLAAGCKTPPAADRNTVSRHVAERFGDPVGPPAPLDDIICPPGLELGRPLTEDHAVLLALWNNALFQEALVDLKITRADLINAGLLPNPELLYTFPEPNKQVRYLIDFPIESLYLRPIRLKVQGRINDQAADRLTQTALDLIRDTRQAYADLALAKDRVRVAAESVRVRTEVAGLAKARLDAGEASVQETATARIDADTARQEATRIGYEVTLAEARLKWLLNLGRYTFPLALDPPAADPGADVGADPEALVAEAVQTRPDALAAADAADAAAVRVRFAKLSWVRFLGIFDATAGRKTGHDPSPGFRVTLPIFNRNQGGVALAEAQLEQAERRRRTVHQQIILDVRLAHARYRQAAAEVAILRDTVRPEVRANIRRAETAYKEGGTSYLLVLEATRQLIDTDLREAALKAELRRTWAELERSVGRRLAPVPPPGPPSPAVTTLPTPASEPLPEPKPAKGDDP